MGSSLFNAAKVASDAIDQKQFNIMSIEKANAFQYMNSIGVVNPARNLFTLSVEDSDFLAFKSAVITRLRSELSTDITSFNSTYACLAFTQLATPEGLTGEVGETTIDLSWSDVTNATGYKVYVSTIDDFTKALLVDTPTESSYLLTGLLAETIYYIWVVAVAVGYRDSDAIAEDFTTTE